MARKVRVQYPGAIYHVMNRGDHQERIFITAADRQLFQDTLEEACEKTGWQVPAFCLMSNHFHLVIETPNANLVEGMKWLLGVYTARFNRCHHLFGHFSADAKYSNYCFSTLQRALIFSAVPQQTFSHEKGSSILAGRHCGHCAPHQTHVLWR